MANRGSQAQNLVLVVKDHTGVDAVGEELVERAIVLLGSANREEPLVEDVADARCEPEAQRRAQDELYAAAGVNGLVADGERQCWATIRRGPRTHSVRCTICGWILHVWTCSA